MPCERRTPCRTEQEPDRAKRTCGKPVDFRLKFPHPLSPCIDHIIPVAKGGHPSDLANLQLAHMTCNRDKSDKLVAQKQEFSGGIELVSNRLLPLTFDWKTI